MGQSSQPHELGGGLKSRPSPCCLLPVLSAQVCLSVPARHRRSGPGGITGLFVRRITGVMIMRMLAEMAVATPDTGSFPPMPIKLLAVGRVIPSAGCLVVLGTGYPTGSQHRRHDPASWVPGIPIWLFSLVITLALMAVIY